MSYESSTPKRPPRQISGHGAYSQAVIQAKRTRELATDIRKLIQSFRSPYPSDASFAERLNDITQILRELEEPLTRARTLACELVESRPEDCRDDTEIKISHRPLPRRLRPQGPPTA